MRVYEEIKRNLHPLIPRKSLFQIKLKYLYFHSQVTSNLDNKKTIGDRIAEHKYATCTGKTLPGLLY